MFKIIPFSFLTALILTFCDNAQKPSIESRISPEPDSIVADILGQIGAHYSNDDLTMGGPEFRDLPFAGESEKEKPFKLNL